MVLSAEIRMTSWQGHGGPTHGRHTTSDIIAVSRQGRSCRTDTHSCALVDFKALTYKCEIKHDKIFFPMTNEQPMSVWDRTPEKVEEN